MDWHSVHLFLASAACSIVWVGPQRWCALTALRNGSIEFSDVLVLGTEDAPVEHSHFLLLFQRYRHADHRSSQGKLNGEAGTVMKAWRSCKTAIGGSKGQRLQHWKEYEAVKPADGSSSSLRTPLSSFTYLLSVHFESIVGERAMWGIFKGNGYWQEVLINPTVLTGEITHTGAEIKKKKRGRKVRRVVRAQVTVSPAWLWVLAQPFITCVNLASLLNLAEPQSPHL